MKPRPEPSDDPVAARTSPADITAAAVASFDGCPEPRLREIMQALTRHLHAFATRGRADAGRVGGGHRHPHRDRPHHRRPAPGVHPLVGRARRSRCSSTRSPTRSRRARPSRPCSGRSTCPARRCASTARTSPSEPAGDPAWVHGRVLDLDGRPIAGAELDVWQNGDDRLYAVQDPEAPGGPPARRVPHARRRQLRLPRRAARPVHDPRRRPGRARCSRPPAATRGGPRTST